MNKLFAKIAGLTAALAMVAGAGVALAHHAEAKGVRADANSFELFSGSLEEGDYIVYYSGKAMNTTVSNDRLQYASVTPVNNVITTSDATIVWHIAASGDYWTLYNADAQAYAAGTGAKNKAQMLEDGTDDKALWSVSGDSTYEFVNKANAAASVNANLRNNGTYGFACYGTSTGGALSLYKLSGTPAPVEYHDVIFNANGEDVTGMPSNLTNQTGTVSLSNVAEPSREGYTFQGWSLTADGEVVSQVTVSNADVNVYAIWQENAPAGNGYVKTAFANLTGGEVGLIVSTKNSNNYAMSNDKGTSAAPAAVSVTVSNDEISTAASNLLWTVEVVEAGYKFKSGDNYLYATNTNNGIRVGSSEDVVFTVSNEGYLVHDATSRYVGVYNSADWRCYTTINNNIKDQTFAFYKESGDTPEPPTPVEKHSVIFNANGENVTGMPSNLTEQTGAVSLSNVAEPSREGYTFKGWSLTTDGAVVTQVTVSNDDVNVYAIWEAVTPEPTREDLPVGDYEVEVSYAGRTSVPTEEYFEIKEPVGETYYKRLKIEYVGVQFLYSNEYTMPKNNPGKKISVSTDSNAKITSVEVNWYQYENATVYIDGVASSTPSGAKGDNENKISYNINANNFELVNNTNYAQSLWGMKISLSVSAVAEPEVAFDNVETSLQVGDSGTYTATSENATNPVYTWSSDNAEVLSITAGGEYHALKAGSAKVTVDLACDEGADSKSVTVLVSPDHTLTVAEAREIANGLDGDKQETTPYRVKVSGYIVSLDADTKTRAFNLSDSKVSAAGDTIMAYGIYSNDPIRQYAILNGTIEFECSIQNYKGTLEVKDLALVSYIDDAMLFAKGAYEALQESCNAGVQAVTETLWGQIAQVYENQLDEYAKAKLQAADVSNYGQDIINWTARYEIIVSNTSLNNFLSRTIGAGRYVSILPSMMANDGSIVIIAIITIASISAIAALIVIKKRKHQ